MREIREEKMAEWIKTKTLALARTLKAETCAGMDLPTMVVETAKLVREAAPDEWRAYKREIEWAYIPEIRGAAIQRARQLMMAITARAAESSASAAAEWAAYSKVLTCAAQKRWDLFELDMVGGGGSLLTLLEASERDGRLYSSWWGRHRDTLTWALQRQAEDGCGARAGGAWNPGRN